MENASKALIMAGGVLLAILILTLLVSVGISITDMSAAQDKKNEMQQLQKFNESYLAYNKTIMYGIDVLSVYNKAKDEDSYFIEILAIDEQENVINIINNKEFKAYVFKCLAEEITYDSITGRINKMVFKKIEI